jgi:SAM-dependent methyltransferase
MNLMHQQLSQHMGSRLNFGSIPFWEGLQTSAGVKRVYPFELEARRNLQLRQIVPTAVALELTAAYSSDEYQFITPPPGASEWANSLGDGKIRVVQAALGGYKPSDILEIGGGSTWVASRLRELYGPRSYLIVDPSVRDAAEGVEILRDYFPATKIEARTFDLVVGFNVLEHVPDPLAFLHSIRKQLTREGRVLLTFPDCERQIQSGNLNVFVHEHLSYFTRESVDWLAANSGFETILLTSSNDLFTLVLRIDDEKKVVRELDESPLLKRCAEAIESMRDVNVARIRTILDKGESVAFHGATPGLNTFLYLTGLGNHSGIRVFDGDSSKAGKYLPAFERPVEFAGASGYGKSSLLVVSAMSFYEQISQFAMDIGGYKPECVVPLTGGGI